MTEREVIDAIDFVLDCYNARRALNSCDDPSVWEPVEISSEGLIYSRIDGREMSEAEFLRIYPAGSFTNETRDQPRP
jgi:hypothetical protein